MGGTLSHTQGPIQFKVDIDRGKDWWDRPLSAQVLQSGTYMPTVVDSFEIRYPAGKSPVPTFTTNIDIANGDWVVLRITDPSAQADGRATGEWATFGNAIAYASPFFLRPG